MVSFISCLALLWSLSSYADFFGSDSSENYQSSIPGLVEKIKNLTMKDNHGFEDSFNLEIKNIENEIEKEKLFCSGEAADNQGRTLPKDQKQLCYRELKTHYLEATETIFNVKKKYLDYLHNRQVEGLSEIQKKLKADIEKSF